MRERGNLRACEMVKYIFLPLMAPSIAQVNQWFSVGNPVRAGLLATSRAASRDQLQCCPASEFIQRRHERPNFCLNCRYGFSFNS